MNLIVRMLYILISSFFKPSLSIGKTKNTLTLRVLPNDIDINLHMNNGRYLTICDLSRVDVFIRTGLAKTMMKNNWIPVISEHTMKYKKPLKTFQKYTLKMEISDWDEKYFYMLHTFIVGDRVVAEGTSKGCILAKEGVITPENVMEKVKEQRSK